MSDNSTIVLSNSDNGDETRVNLSVLEVILGIAARDVDGVAAMRGSFKNDLGKLLGWESEGKGVSVSVTDGKLSADVYVYLDAGVSVPKVSAAIQENLASQLDQMTDLKLQEINVHVVGLVSPEEKEQVVSADKENNEATE